VLVGALDLSLHLGLSDDHRLQPRRHPEELARGVAVARRDHERRQLGRADVRAARQAPEQLGLGLDGLRGDDVDLRAVARRDDDGLADLVAGDELAREPVRLAAGEGQALAQRDRRALVGDAQREQLAHRPTASRSGSACVRAASSSSSCSSRCTRPSFAAMIAT
jgi:hypothetical protein